MLAAVAVVSLRTGVFPPWLGWLSALAAAANLVMSLGIVADSASVRSVVPALMIALAEQ